MLTEELQIKLSDFHEYLEDILRDAVRKEKNASKLVAIELAYETVFKLSLEDDILFIYSYGNEDSAETKESSNLYSIDELITIISEL